MFAVYISNAHLFIIRFKLPIQADIALFISKPALRLRGQPLEIRHHRLDLFVAQLDEVHRRTRKDLPEPRLRRAPVVGSTPPFSIQAVTGGAPHATCRFFKDELSLGQKVVAAPVTCGSGGKSGRRDLLRVSRQCGRSSGAGAGGRNDQHGRPRQQGNALLLNQAPVQRSPPSLSKVSSVGRAPSPLGARPNSYRLVAASATLAFTASHIVVDLGPPWSAIHSPVQSAWYRTNPPEWVFPPLGVGM